MKTILPLASCILFTVSALALEPDIIIDANENAGAVELAGSGWGNDGSTANAFRNAAMVVNSSTSSHFARFHTRLPKAGPYSVFVWHNGGSGFAYSAPTTVTHADAAATSVALNQYMNYGQWLLLGTFWFEGDDDGSGTCKEAEVKITGSSGKLSADAVRFMSATADLTLDSDTGGSAVAFSGSWSSVTDKAGTAGNVRRSNAANATVAYTFTVPASGDYEVSLWLPGNAFTGSTTWLATGLTGASSFSVEVQHPTAANQSPPASTTAAISLPSVLQNEGRWVKLVNPATATMDAPRTGTFRFKATATGIANKVIITTAGVSPASAYVPADAVRLTKVGPWATFMDEDDATAPPVPYVTTSATTGSWTNNTTLTARNYSEWSRVNFGPSWKYYNFSQSLQGPASVTFTPQVDELGLYDVYLWFPNSYYPQNNPVTKLTVTAAAGDVSGTMDQRIGTGIWRHAGRFTLHPSSAGTNPPKVKIQTPDIPASPPYYWWYYNQGHVHADGLMILQDAENVDTDGDGLMDWFETYAGTNPNGGTGEYNYVAYTLGYYPDAATLNVTVTAPPGATLEDPQ